MNETELHDVFETLTRNPVPSRYGVGSAREASTRRRRRKWSAVAVAVVVASVIAGTTWLFDPSASPGPSDLSPSGVVDLDGTWMVTSLAGTDERDLLGGGFNTSLTFKSGRVTGKAGCVEVAGTYKQPDDQSLLFSDVRRIDSDVSIQSSYCVGPPLDQRLPDVRHVNEVDGTLLLLAANKMIIASLTRSTPSPESTETPASASDPPRRLNMQVVRQVGSSQKFRAYSGPQPPPTSEVEAIRSVQGDEVYSLGLHDIGFVHYSGSVEWHSVWIIASDRFKPDINGGEIGGPMTLGPDGNLVPVQGAPVESTEPVPGWARSVTMIDVATGKELMGLSF